MKPRTVLVTAVFVAALLVSGVAFAATDVNINGDVPGTVQNEVRIIRNPIDANNLAVAYNDNIGQATSPLGISFSTDGGVTWSDRNLSVPTHPIIGSPDDGIALPFIFDPFIEAGPAGDLYAGYIAADGNLGGPGGLYLERSQDKGNSWSGSTNITFDLRATIPNDPNYRFNDRPDMTVDTSGNVSVVWIKDVGMTGPASDIYFSRSPAPVAATASNPTGLDFTGATTGSVSPKTVNDKPNGGDWANVPDVAVASDGTIYVSWIDVDVTNPLAKTGRLMLDRSTDNGATFGVDSQVLAINALPSALTTAAGVTDARSGSYAVIGVDPIQPQHVYLAFAAYQGVDEADIFFIRSLDGGANWSIPIRVNSDATTNDQFHPMLAVDPAGTIVLAWYDRRNAPGDDRWDVYSTTSSDGGLTFATESLITDASFATPTSSSGQPWMGEYLGLDVDATVAYVAFTSSAVDGFGDLYFDTFALPTPPFRCAGVLATIVGTAGADVLNGTAGVDVIVGLGGNDTVNAGGGDDIVCLGDGNDTAHGGDGRDLLLGELGNDKLWGGTGKDRLFGGDGRDRLYGEGHHDILKGGRQLDWLWGGLGNDRLYGGPGNDEVAGLKGDDLLWGQRGNDLLIGGPGNDQADGGPHTDTCKAETVLNCEP